MQYEARRNYLYKKLEAFILSKSPSDQAFDTLALELWRYQYDNTPSYANYCQALSVSPENWHTIPAVPTDAFKQLDIPLTSLTEEDRQTTFRTSGTTGESRGEHHFYSTSLYETSILTAWGNLPEMGETFFLTPSPQETKDSSLAHMMETIRKKHVPDAQFLMHAGQIELTPLREAIDRGQPITLLGTALAFLHIAERQQFVLPSGSWAMETGGYKGTGKTLQKPVFYDMLHKAFGLDPDNIWNEYSMTELSSQCYTKGLDQPHTTPPWVRIRVIDPKTNQPVSAGSMGYLEMIDLANLDSVCAIRTQDIALYHSSREFTLLGRDPSAIPRGCSRSAAESLNKHN